MLPFPPRVFAKEYMAINPLGTIPYLVDGETRMTESSAISRITSAFDTARHPLVVDPTSRPMAPSNWTYFRDATLTATLVLRYSQLEREKSARNPVWPATTPMVFGPAAGGRSRHRQGDAESATSLYRCRYRQRLCPAARRKYRARQGFRTECGGVLGPASGPRRFQAGGGGGTEGRRRAECGREGSRLMRGPSFRGDA